MKSFSHKSRYLPRYLKTTPTQENKTSLSLNAFAIPACQQIFVGKITSKHTGSDNVKNGPATTSFSSKRFANNYGTKQLLNKTDILCLIRVQENF